MLITVVFNGDPGLSFVVVNSIIFGSCINCWIFYRSAGGHSTRCLVTSGSRSLDTTDRSKIG